MWKRVLTAAALGIVFVTAWVALREIPINVVGQPSLTGAIQQRLEQPFFETLAQNTRLSIKVLYRPNDQLGFRDSHQLPMVRDGEIDLVSLRFLQNAGHEPSLLGIDPWGLAADFDTARDVVRAYGPVLDERLQAKFNAKLLGVWPFGPQIFFCRKPVAGLADLKGLRIRIGNENFAPLMSAFGATPVVITFEEVRSALAAGMVDCAISSAGSGNSAGWAQHSTHLFTLGTQMGLNGYVINLDLWKRFSSREQAVLQSAFDRHVEEIWSEVQRVHKEAISCSTAGPCPEGVLANMEKRLPSKDDLRMLREAFQRTTFKDWALRCDEQYPGCSADWLARVEPFLSQQVR
jgi:TRAP-type transport system periplasmic protein